MDAAAALDQLAALHGTWWGRLPDAEPSFLTQRGDPTAHAVLLPMLHQGFVQRYGDTLDPDVLRAAEALIERAEPYLADREGPEAVVHGDFRPDNLLVGAESVAVVDWQTVGFGAALADVSYFLGGALSADDRMTHEAELLDRYRSVLAAHGVNLDASSIEAGYRRYALDGLVMAIGASQVVGQTERGDAMFCAMAERSAVHAMQADTLSLF